MSRHSSGTVLRAVVILAVLAALPMLALGSAVLPDSVRDWFSRYWPAVKPATAPAPLSAPQFEPVPATAVPPLNSTAPWQSGGDKANPADPRVGPSGLIAHDNSTQGYAPAASYNPTAPAPLGVSDRVADRAAAGGQMPATSAPVDDARSPAVPAHRPVSAASAWSEEASRAAARRPDDRGPSVMPVSYQAVSGELPTAAAAMEPPRQSDLPMPSVETPAAVPSATVGALPSDTLGDRNQSEQFQSFQRRLHDLGATYLLLETWGERQQLYRCFCKVAIGGNPNCTRHFEATDADPLRALAAVTEQVEQWRQGQP